MFAGVGERTREGNDLYKEMTESVSVVKSFTLWLKTISSTKCVSQDLNVGLHHDSFVKFSSASSSSTSCIVHISNTHATHLVSACYPCMLTCPCRV